MGPAPGALGSVGTIPEGRWSGKDPGTQSVTRPGTIPGGTRPGTTSRGARPETIPEGARPGTISQGARPGTISEATSGPAVDAFCASAVLEVCAAAGAWREALEIVESIRSRGVVPGSRCA